MDDDRGGREIIFICVAELELDGKRSSTVNGSGLVEEFVYCRQTETEIGLVANFRVARYPGVCATRFTEGDISVLVA